MRWIDRLERNEILERHMPYAFDLCQWCEAPEGEPHQDDCMWVKIRNENNVQVAA